MVLFLELVCNKDLVFEAVHDASAIILLRLNDDASGRNMSALHNVVLTEGFVLLRENTGRDIVNVSQH